MEPKTPLVQDYLSTHSLQDLYKNHGIRAGVYGDLMSINYHQIKSRRTDPMAQECRGIVLRHSHEDLQLTDIVGDTDLYAWPFPRFFNYNEGDEVKAEIDWTTASIQEKPDGTLCILYWDKVRGRWNVGTRNTPFGQFATNPYNPTETVRVLFEKAVFNLTGGTVDELAEHLCPHSREYTWLFELTSPVNQIVVKYDTLSITGLGRRSVVTGMESNAAPYFKNCGIPTPPTYLLSDLGDVINFVQRRNPEKHEGVVVCDAYFNRIKVKSAAYALANGLQGKLASSPRKIVDIILEEGWDDVVGGLPPYIQEQGSLMAETFQEIVDANLEAFKYAVDATANSEFEPGSREHRKEFALAAKSQPGVEVSALMHSYRKSPEEVVAWFYYKDQRDQSLRTKHIKRITKMIQQEMERNGTSKKEFWEVKEDEEA